MRDTDVSLARIILDLPKKRQGRCKDLNYELYQKI